ncbi:MAG: hypothetical protein EA371_03730 [Gammaproteobacteria bacterium]|nr:MAG: hypothetical protein EA371_03730 [Gammaproteobacteria bacterium]
MIARVPLIRGLCACALLSLALAGAGFALADAGAPRARDLGIPLSGTPGPLNAITDVAGLEVGQVSVTTGEARTGVTVLFPRGRDAEGGVPAGIAVFNGTGEMTGAMLVQEFGVLYGPVVLTGTLGVGTARNGLLEWTRMRIDDPVLRASRMLPLIAETYDGGLSDAWSLPLQPSHVVDALDSARSGPVAEGSVGGGTGMVCYAFKCGIGTASRRIPAAALGQAPDAGDYTVGVLVQANFGRRDQLTVAGLPVGQLLDDLRPRHAATPAGLPDGDGSLIVLIATDAPLLPAQLERLARRATIGMARTGSWGTATSGDIFLAFSTATEVEFATGQASTHLSLPNELLDPLLEAAALGTEEAILNALVAGRDMEGRGGSKVYGLPQDRLTALLAAHPRPGQALPAPPTATAVAPNTPAHSATPLTREIDAFLQVALDTGPYPALAVSVHRGGEVLYEAAHGWADLEHRVPATPQTVFRIGSITKSFTSLLIAQLVAEGVLTLDTPVGDILTDYRGPAREVPIRRLMNHTAGLLNYTELEDFPHATRAVIPADEMRAFFETAELLHTPGERFHYSNSGTFLLGLVIEAVTGQTWGEALRTRVLDPLDLAHTDHGDWQPVVAHRARGYTPTAEGFVNAPWLDVSVPFSAGSMTSTLADVQRYLRRVHVDNVFGDEVRDILHTREPLTGGEPVDYALGAVVIRERLDRRMLGHPGAIDGFSAYMTLYPDDDLSIVVLANAPFGLPDPVAIEQRVARLVFGLPRPQASGETLAPETLASLAGDYLPGAIRMGLPPLGVIVQDDGLALRFGGMAAPGDALPLVHVEGRRFIAAHDESMEFRFEPGDGEATGLVLDWFGALLPYERAAAD